MSEVARVLRVGGRACVYVWAVEQEKNNVKSKYLRPSKTPSSPHCQPGMSAVTGEFPNLPVHVNGTAFKAQDTLVPWHLKRQTGAAGDQECDTLVAGSGEAVATDVSSEAKNTQILHRYYHTFVEGELQRLGQQLEGVRVVNSYYDQGNWCVIIERTLDLDV